MKLIPFTHQDYAALRGFMQPLWLETYGSFLPREQILFLLDKYFLPENISRFLKDGYRYFWIDDVGVLVYVEREKEVYIDKLYLLPAARGHGYAKFVFDQLLRHKKDVTLNVNQSNTRAVACYKKNGFTVDETVAINLRNGMTNHDYVMRKRYE